MTASTLLDYDADARTRLWELLERRNISCRDQLKQSVDTAGEQLERFKPSVMGPGKRSLLAGGPVVIVPPGTVLFVLAHHKKVFTIWLRHSGTLTEAVEEAVRYIKEMVESEEAGFKWSGDQTLVVIEDLIGKYGRPPGKHGTELAQEHNGRILRMLFAVIPDEARADMIKGLEMIIGMKVCPAMVGLIGKGRETGSCGVWPLVLPLASYVDAVIEE
jgi:hypothetical protein